MGGFREYYNKIKGKDVDSLVGEAVRFVAPQIRQTNIDQMMEGIGNDGELITPDYSNTGYAKYKKQLYPGSRPLMTPNLKLTGLLHQRTQVLQIDTNSLRIDNTVDYAADVYSKYSTMWGLTTDNMAEKRDIATKKLIELYRK